MTKVSSTNLSQSLGGCGKVLRALTSNFTKQVSSDGTDGGAHGSTMHLFIILTLEEGVGVFKAELQEGDCVGWTCWSFNVRWCLVIVFAALCVWVGPLVLR